MKRFCAFITAALALLTISASIQASVNYVPLPDYGDMLMIVYDPYMTQSSLNDFVQWKKQKGINVVVVKSSDLVDYEAGDLLESGLPETPSLPQLPNTEKNLRTAFQSTDEDDTVQCCYGSDPFDPQCTLVLRNYCLDTLHGTVKETGFNCIMPCTPATYESGTTVEIKNYIEDFRTLDSNLLWVVLVGNSEQIPTKQWRYHDVDLQEYYYQSSDAAYSILDGDSAAGYPDIIVGRFPVTNYEELTTLVERTITYERDLPLVGENTSWYQRAGFIARADDVVNHTGTVNTAHMRIAGDTLATSSLSMTIDSIYEIHHPSPPWNTASFSTMLNTGVSIWNYDGHGGEGGLNNGASGALFTKSDIYDLTNVNRLPIIYMGACNVAAIWNNTGTFGEALVTTADENGDPVGGVAAYVSSATQFVPPIDDAIIAFNKLVARGSDSTFGTLCFNSASIMKTENTGNVVREMFLGWHVFGDPSLVIRTHEPAALTVTRDTLKYGDDTLHVMVVNQSSQPVSGVRCALYYNTGGTDFDDGTLFGTAVTNGSGQAAIPIAGTLPIGQNVKLTVTGYNKKTSVQNVPVGYDLEVFPNQYPNTKDTASPYTITALVYSSTSISPNYPKLEYRINSGSWVPVTMTLQSGHTYAGNIPKQAAGTKIDYKISVQNAASNTYQSDTYHFMVYAYYMSMTTTYTDSAGPSPMYVWYNATITNEGAVSDSYSMNVSGNDWQTTLWETDRTTSLISPVSITTGSPTFTFAIRVRVDDTAVGHTDEAIITATSIGDDTISAVLTFTTTSEGRTLSLPLFDAFTSTTLDETNRWDTPSTGTIETLAPNETTSPYSFNFNRELSAPIEGSDKLLSRMLNLSEDSGVVLGYYYERTGEQDRPESGEDLIFEYFDSSRNWDTLSTQAGSGSNMTTFSKVVVNIPAEGYHQRFRIRVTAPSSGAVLDTFGAHDTYDNWFVDNIAVAHIPAAPTLASPSNNSTVTTSWVILDWNDLAYANRWNVQVDNDSTFASIDRQLNADNLVSSQWTVTSTLTNGTWFWRVRASEVDSFWGAWSSTWKFTRNYSPHPPPPPSCPVLYHFDGSDFVKDNTLFTACERSGYVEVVPDNFLLPDNTALIGNSLKLQLRELEDETSYIHTLELAVVDHPVGTNVSVTTSGDIITYDGKPLQPISAIDNSGHDCLDAIRAIDGSAYTSATSGYLTVVFKRANGGYSFNSTGKELCGNDPKVSPFDSSAVNRVTVSYLNAENEWEAFDNVSPREYQSYESVYSDGLNAITSDTVAIRFSWTKRISFDVIQQLVPSNKPADVHRYSVTKLSTIKQGDESATTASSFLEPVVLNKGDVLDFSFDIDTSIELGMTRSYVVSGMGRYQPDANAYPALLPKEFSLYNNYPNPFNPTTSIAFDVPKASHVKLEVYNIMGQSVATLVDGWKSAGRHVALWNGKNSGGHEVASGVYFYILQAGDFRQSKKMTLLK